MASRIGATRAEFKATIMNVNFQDTNIILNMLIDRDFSGLSSCGLMSSLSSVCGSIRVLHVKYQPGKSYVRETACDLGSCGYSGTRKPDKKKGPGTF